MQNDSNGTSPLDSTETDKTDLGPTDVQSVPSPVPQPVVSVVQKSHKGVWIAVLVGLALVLVGGGFWLGMRHTKKSAQPSTTTHSAATQATQQTANVQGLQLDASKKYGDKYANGLLPVGDGKYTTDAPKTGYVYACSQYAQNLTSDKGGAGARGPWFVNNNTQYDLSKKLHVLGSVTWQPSLTNTVSGQTRTVITNDLPNHTTGVFPIASSDPAYAYDRNPNSIKGQSLTYTLAANPTYNATPNCMGGESGVMLTGVALFNAFDAGGRDAGAWEIQDNCGGHPEKEGEYHYHTLSSCIQDTSVHTVIGYALDGFPITGPKVGTGNILTTSDLDECHGIVSSITLNGKTTTMYHYVMTQDFPYSVSCFRGTAITPPELQPGQGPQTPPRP